MPVYGWWCFPRCCACACLCVCASRCARRSHCQARFTRYRVLRRYRFVTTFSPFVMGGLLMFKLVLPFVACCAAFLVLTRSFRAPFAGHFVVVLVRGS